MTGAWFRIKNGPEWGNVELDQMTFEQLKQLRQRSQDPQADGLKYAIFMADWILGHILELDEDEKSLLLALKEERVDDPDWSWNAVGFLCKFLQENEWGVAGVE